MSDLLTTDLIAGGASGLVIGGVLGYLAKRAFKLLFKTMMVIGILWIGSLFYLQSIRVINVNENALNNLVNSSYTTVNNIINTNCNSEIMDCATQPVHNILASLGIPLTSGLFLGFLAGWAKA